MLDPQETSNVRGCELNWPALGGSFQELCKHEPFQITWHRVRDRFLGSIVSGL